MDTSGSRDDQLYTVTCQQAQALEACSRLACSDARKQCMCVCGGDQLRALIRLHADAQNISGFGLAAGSLQQGGQGFLVSPAVILPGRVSPVAECV